jgi:hypothetical protein
MPGSPLKQFLLPGGIWVARGDEVNSVTVVQVICRPFPHLFNEYREFSQVSATPSVAETS